MTNQINIAKIGKESLAQIGNVKKENLPFDKKGDIAP